MSVEALRDKVRALMPRARSDLAEMVSFQSVYNTESPPEDCAKMVEWLRKAFTEAGLRDVRGHETTDGSLAVCGHADGPAGSPTVLLYFHHDVQPAPNGNKAWDTPPWKLTEAADGRLYGRGAADCKGNIAVHLTALRALAGKLPLNIKIVGEGSEEVGSNGLGKFVPGHRDLFEADVILVCDTGNAGVGAPALTTSLRGMVRVVVTVETLRSPVHSGVFGGAAPDALAALIHMLASLRDEHGNTTVRGVRADQTWADADYPAGQFRANATVLDGVKLLGGEKAKVSDMVWARPTATVLGIDCPPATMPSPAAIQAQATARIDLRVPPGVDAGEAKEALKNHLTSVAPWNVQVHFGSDGTTDGPPFTGTQPGPGHAAMSAAMKATYSKDVVKLGQGGSIPLCNVFKEEFKKAEIMLLGVEEPQCRIHAPNESVDPSEIENMALVEALFLQNYAAARSRRTHEGAEDDPDE